VSQEWAGSSLNRFVWLKAMTPISPPTCGHVRVPIPEESGMLETPHLGVAQFVAGGADAARVCAMYPCNTSSPCAFASPASLFHSRGRWKLQP
jgi:hypothetical protein